jgi:predicted chitinase
MVTATQVRSIARTLGAAPRADLVAAIVRGWPQAKAKADLTTRDRAAFFLANIMTETGGLKILSESGAYSAARIEQIFGVGRHSAKVTDAEARQIAALPVARRGPVLFDRVYGIGNPTKAREFGHTRPGQGWLYRGGGMLQTTGLRGYARRAKETGLPLVEHPELLHQPDAAFQAAYLTWGQDKRANRFADAGDIKACRKVINGGINGLAECRKYTAKALAVLADYAVADEAVDDPAGPAIEPDPIAPEPVPLPEPRPVDAPPNVQPVDPAVPGDPILYATQTRLKARRYPPGKLDGLWGGGTSGALSGFMNDRGLRLHLPINLKEFHEIADEVAAELTEAEQENWFRPVSAERANADPKIVRELAPEVAPAKRNFFAALWASIAAFFSAIWETVSGYVGQAWDFFTDHRDVVDDHPGIMSTVVGHITAVPASVWLAVAGAGLAFIAYNAWSAIRTSTMAVQSGERQ